MSAKMMSETARGGRIADAELSREARRLFRKLIGGTAFIGQSGKAYGLFSSPAAKRPGLRVEEKFLRECVARGWLMAAPDGRYVLSQAGEGWYLRAQAGADPFAAQHRSLRPSTADTGEGPQAVLRNDAESPLAWLYARKLIDRSQFEAGERLRRDYTIGQLSARLGVDLSMPISSRSGGAGHLSDTVLAAKQRFRAAMVAAGPGLADLLFDVCCDLTGLAEIEKAKDWPRRSAKIVLDIALDRLARHYGLQITARASAPTRAWRRED